MMCLISFGQGKLIYCFFFLVSVLLNIMIFLNFHDFVLKVCAYKDGEVIIDTAAGVLGRYDPRPVQPDSLFPVFSVTKGITAGMLHWLIDAGCVF